MDRLSSDIRPSAAPSAYASAGCGSSFTSKLPVAIFAISSSIDW
jgi:hypothetical protein